MTDADRAFSEQEEVRLLREINATLVKLGQTAEATMHAIAGLTSDLLDWKAEWELANIELPQVQHFTITTTQGDAMPAVITVDTKTGLVHLGATDDHNDPVDIPAGSTANFASDSAALTIGAEAPGTDPTTGKATITAPLTPVSLADGTSAPVPNISAAPKDPNGAAFLEADGVTAVPDPTPVPQPVIAGAVGAFTLGDTA